MASHSMKVGYWTCTSLLRMIVRSPALRRGGRSFSGRKGVVAAGNQHRTGRLDGTPARTFGGTPLPLWQLAEEGRFLVGSCCIDERRAHVNTRCRSSGEELMRGLPEAQVAAGPEHHLLLRRASRVPSSAVWASGARSVAPQGVLACHVLGRSSHARAVTALWAPPHWTRAFWTPASLEVLGVDLLQATLQVLLRGETPNSLAHPPIGKAQRKRGMVRASRLLLAA